MAARGHSSSWWFMVVAVIVLAWQICAINGQSTHDDNDNMNTASDITVPTARGSDAASTHDDDDNMNTASDITVPTARGSDAAATHADDDNMSTASDMTVPTARDSDACSPACVNGECVDNNLCLCASGWVGPTCDTPCGGNYTSKTGIITHPFATDSNYGNAEFCIWTINKREEPCKVKLSFTRFHTEKNYDKLFIRDEETGSEIAELSGSSIPDSFIVDSCDVKVLFASDKQTSNTGFELEWKQLAECKLACVNGDCTEPDTCSCETGWTGPQCNQAECNDACVNGDCTAPDTCTCKTGWTGPQCNQAECNNACVNGVCTKPDTCTCKTGWTGPQCDQAQCKLACVNGDCTEPDTCTCKTGWTGPQCNQAVCNRACVNGDCTEPNKCTCKTGWSGPQCDQEVGKCRTRSRRCKRMRGVCVSEKANCPGKMKSWLCPGNGCGCCIPRK